MNNFISFMITQVTVIVLLMLTKHFLENKVSRGIVLLDLDRFDLIRKRLIGHIRKRNIHISECSMNENRETKLYKFKFCATRGIYLPFSLSFHCLKTILLQPLKLLFGHVQFILLFQFFNICRAYSNPDKTKLRLIRVQMQMIHLGLM